MRHNIAAFGFLRGRYRESGHDEVRDAHFACGSALSDGTGPVSHSMRMEPSQAHRGTIPRVAAFALKALGVTVVGIVLGLLTAWLALSSAGGMADGPWRTSLTAGDAESGAYARARVALHGLFALNRGETLYYTAATDSDDHRLDGACRYEVYGRAPDARWWSITAYGADDYLIPNPANRYSVAKTTAMMQPDNSFSVQVSRASTSPQASRENGGGNWIAVEPGRFTLTLRLYNPAPDIARDPRHAVLPAIKLVSCR